MAFLRLARIALAGELRDIAALTDNELRRSNPRFLPCSRERDRLFINDFDVLAAKAGVTPARLSLARVLSRNEHAHAIPGTRSISHFEQNHAATVIVPSPWSGSEH